MNTYVTMKNLSMDAIEVSDAQLDDEPAVRRFTVGRDG
jgi:hypothetical protein